MGKILRIERLAPRPGGEEIAHQTPRGYKLADPRFGRNQHLLENAIFVATLDEAAGLIARGYWIWMGRPGKRASLISPDAVRVVRAVI